MSQPLKQGVRLLLGLLFAGGCMPGAATPTATDPAFNAASGTAAVLGRLEAVGSAVSVWRSAQDLATAQRAAEEARNLVVGPFGPFYGDVDGTLEGASEIGLLPGSDGEPGLASPELGDCVVRDVLGGDWSDAGARWDILLAAIDQWTPTNNTFPSLPSHPQRLVGWATLTLETDDLATAIEYAGHARLHLEVSLGALEECVS